MNLDRASARRSIEVANGITLALGGDPGREFYEAIADSPEQAAELILDAKIRRREQKVAAKHGF